MTSTPNSPGFPHIVDGFGLSLLAPALWRRDAATGLQLRNLALAQASGDVLVARHLRAAGRATKSSSLADSASPFAFVFVLRGKALLREGGGEPVLLDALGSACRWGCGMEHTWELSHDAEVVEITGGPDSAPALGDPPARCGRWEVNHDEEDHYLIGEGPRRYFRYRDLGVAAASGRRIHIHVVRATQSLDGGTGWHSHSMGQLFYVLRGWADLAVEHQPWLRMAAGDAMCIGRRMAHNVPAFSEDYLVLEMCIPADYDTLDVAGET